MEGVWRNGEFALRTPHPLPSSGFNLRAEHRLSSSCQRSYRAIVRPIWQPYFARAYSPTTSPAPISCPRIAAVTCSYVAPAGNASFLSSAIKRK